MIYPNIERLDDGEVCVAATQGRYRINRGGRGPSWAGYDPIMDACDSLGFGGGIVLEHYLGIWVELLTMDDIQDGDDMLPDHLIDLCKALAGPHGHVILKAYRIKHGLERP